MPAFPDDQIGQHHVLGTGLLAKVAGEKSRAISASRGGLFRLLSGRGDQGVVEVDVDRHVCLTGAAAEEGWVWSTAAWYGVLNVSKAASAGDILALL